jgi:hypothetical protein
MSSHWDDYTYECDCISECDGVCYCDGVSECDSSCDLDLDALLDTDACGFEDANVEEYWYSYRYRGMDALDDEDFGDVGDDLDEDHDGEHLGTVLVHMFIVSETKSAGRVDYYDKVQVNLGLYAFLNELCDRNALAPLSGDGWCYKFEPDAHAYITPYQISRMGDFYSDYPVAYGDYLHVTMNEDAWIVVGSGYNFHEDEHSAVYVNAMTGQLMEVTKSLAKILVYDIYTVVGYLNTVGYSGPLHQVHAMLSSGDELLIPFTPETS